MRPIRVWLSAVVWGLALIVSTGSGPVLRADEPRERDREAESREDRDEDRVERHEREEKVRDHRDHQEKEGQERVHADRDRDHEDRDHDDRPRPHDADHRPDGPTAVRDSVNDEMLDLSRALRRIDQSYGFRGIQGCGAWTAGSAYMDWDARGFGNRPHPPMVRDPGLHEGRFSQGRSRDHHTCGGCGHAYPLHGQPICGCVLPPRPLILGGCCNAAREDDNCSLLTRRICTGCGHVYPRNEQPRCHCHGGEAHHAPHHAPHHGPDHRPHDGPDREPTPVDSDPPPPQGR